MTTGRDPEFPEYGSGGDYAGARRNRRAFRYGVATAVLFTFMLWFSEQYLRYEETERLYLLALTHEPESARVLLRQAIKIDSATEERPTAKYAAALAEREEEDRRLAAYDRAYELDPANAFLAMRYGCELFRNGEMRRAHELFRAAYEHDPENALPLYLEAATLPFIEAADLHLEESFQLVMRANDSGMPVVFQRPLWFSTLPQRGEWYARWYRNVAQEALAPIQAFATKMLELAHRDLEDGNRGVWDQRLAALETMGLRIARDTMPEIGMTQALMGLTLQLRVLELAKQFEEVEDRNLAHFADQERAIQRALAIVNTFEHARTERIVAQKEILGVPLSHITTSFTALLIIYAVVYAISRLLQARRRSWTLRHSMWARGVILGGCALLLTLMFLLSYMAFHAQHAAGAVSIISAIWFVVLATIAVTGVFYPGFMLPLAHLAAREREKEFDDKTRLLVLARRARRIAYVSLMRRYYGVLIGCLAITVCLWTLGFRIYVGLYPWQIKLLAPGLGEHEREAIRMALRVLGGD